MISNSRDLINEARERKTLAKALEMELVVLNPRPRTFLNRIPCQDSDEVQQIQRRRILQMTFSKNEKYAVDKLISDFKETYRSKRRNRFNDLMLLSVWFEIRPKHFLNYIHHFLKFAAEEIHDDGNLLAKHLITIVRASKWHLMLQGLPLDAVSKELHMQYASEDGYGVKIAGTSAPAISNKFFKTVFKQTPKEKKEREQREISEQNAVRLALAIICHCISIDAFLDINDTYTDVGESWAEMDAKDEMKAVREHPHLADLYNESDSEAKKIRRGLDYLQSKPVKTERKKFEKLKKTLARIPDQTKKDSGYQVSRFSDSQIDFVKQFCFCDEQREHVDEIYRILGNENNFDDDDMLDLLWEHYQAVIEAVRVRTIRQWMVVADESEWFPDLPEGIEDLNPIAIRKTFTELLHGTSK